MEKKIKSKLQNKNKPEIRWLKLIFCFIIVYFIAFLGSLFTDTSGWYESVKPSITPPNIVFPIVWNILFFLIAISLYLILMSRKERLIWLIEANLLFNIFWSILFFGLKLPVLAFVDLILLLLSIILIILFSWKIDKRVSYLMLPYFLWIIFAGILNYLIAF